MPELVERRAAAVRAREAVERAPNFEGHVQERIENQLSSVVRAALKAEAADPAGERAA